MKKQEAKAFFEENYGRYNDSGYFQAALRGPLEVLKKAYTGREPIKAEEDGKNGVVFYHLMEFAAGIVDMIDFAAKYPELEIAVTGVATDMTSDYPVQFAWYSPAGSPELSGTSGDDPIGGIVSGKFLFTTNDDSHMQLVLNRNAKFIHVLPDWENEDHDMGYVAAWWNARKESGAYDLLDRERLEAINSWFDSEEEREEYLRENPIPPQITALADTVSRLDGLKDGPEGEAVIQTLWNTLFPEAGIHIQREDGKCRYFDKDGGEYFLLCGTYSETEDDGAFFDRYAESYDLWRHDAPHFWGFPPLAAWIPPELFSYEDLDEDDEDEEDEDW